MTTAELKTSIFSEINNVKDPQLLESVLTIIDTFLKNPGEPAFTKEQVRRMKISREQANRNEFISNDEVDSEMDKWLER